MFTEPTTFRPRNGLSAEAYWRVRAWCEKNGFSWSDVLNALLVPVAYYLENHCIVEPEKSKATVILNVGELEILHVFKGKCYPLASSLSNDYKESLTLQHMLDRIEHWKEANAARPEEYDLMLLPNKDVKAKTRTSNK